MWRVHGFVGRVLHRCHANTPLRLSQNHHVEDEVINTSSVLSTSLHPSDSRSHKEGDGERRKKQRTFQFTYTELPRYTALDAVGWGAAAALFMQICRRIHSQFSSSTDTSPPCGALKPPSSLQQCGYRLLLDILFRHDVLPRGRSVLCLQNQGHSLPQSSSSSSSQSSSEQNHRSPDNSISDQQRASLPDLPEESLLSPPSPLQNDTSQDSREAKADDEKMLTDEEKLAEAVLNLRHVGDTNVPVILNIIGLQSAKSEKHEEAFACFLAAAQCGYIKAQFNTGVCYERGRGVGGDRDKALHYYRQAAVGGHRLAQYRYAKLLLTSRGKQSVEELSTAISLLEQAAAAGLTKAQVCLASVFAQEPVRDSRRSVQYLQMAAQNRDDTALLLLGQCYESGFGVQHNLRIAVELYRQAAQAGNKQAKLLLMPETNAHDAVLRSIRSSPCFSVSNRQPQQLLSSLASHIPASTSLSITLPLLPHSWSTGSLYIPPALSSTPLHAHMEGASCQWTVGIG